MYEQGTGLLDSLIIAFAVSAALSYLYRKLFKKKNSCGSACSSCPINPKNKPKP